MPDDLMTYEKLCDLASSGKLDTPIIHKLGLRTAVYTDADLRHRTTVADQLMSVLRATARCSLLYWSTSKSLPYGDCAYRRALPTTDKPRKRVVSCLQCNAPTRRKEELFGRCAECVRHYPLLTSGVYEGELAKRVATIPQEDRDYTDMSEQDNKLLAWLDSKMCSRCKHVSTECPLIAGKCWCCFQTGHVSLSSGQYAGEPVMLVASKHEDYDGEDLTPSDRQLLATAQDKLEIYEEARTRTCDTGPQAGMSWEEIARGDWSRFKTHQGRYLSLLVFCATFEMLQSELPTSHL